MRGLLSGLRKLISLAAHLCLVGLPARVRVLLLQAHVVPCADGETGAAEQPVEAGARRAGGRGDIGGLGLVGWVLGVWEGRECAGVLHGVRRLLSVGEEGVLTGYAARTPRGARRREAVKAVAGCDRSRDMV